MKPRLGWLCLIGYAAVVAQGTLLRHVSLGAVGPDLVLAVAVFLALAAPRYPALMAAWALGLAKDLSSGGPLGAWAVLFLGAAALVVSVRDKVFTRQPLTQVLLAGMAAFPINLVYLTGRWAAHRWTTPWWTCPLLALGGAAYTAALVPGVVWVLSRFRLRLGLGEQRRIA